MEPENIDWDNIDSTFIRDDTYENFNAPKWVDLSASDYPPIIDDDQAWFCTHDCKHPKTAQDFLKSTTTSNSKAKLLRIVSFSEIIPFRDRHKREKSSTADNSFYVKCSDDKSTRPNCLGDFDEGKENKNPNYTAPKLDTTGSTRVLKKPLLRSNTNRDYPKEMSCSKECNEKGHGRSMLRSTFSEQNLLGSREILSQKITGFCSKLKRLAMKGSKKGGINEKGSSQNGVSEKLKEKSEEGHREMVPLLVLREGTLP